MDNSTVKHMAIRDMQRFQRDNANNLGFSSMSLLRMGRTLNLGGGMWPCNGVTCFTFVFMLVSKE